jgi:hypothetical protein
MPRLINLTAELMGDPAAAYRRAPTDEEMRNRGGGTVGYNLDTHARRQAKRQVGPYVDWQIGDTRIIRDSRHMANVKSRVTEKHGYTIRWARLPDGTYTVTRTA